MTAALRSRDARSRAGLALNQPRPRQLPGTRIADLAALGKAIILCGACAPKFDASRHGYVTKSNLPFARGRCDGCGETVHQARVFLHHANLPR